MCLVHMSDLRRPAREYAGRAKRDPGLAAQSSSSRLRKLVCVRPLHPPGHALNSP